MASATGRFPDGDGGAPGHGSKDAPTQSYGGEQALQCRVLVIAPSSIPFCGCALHLEPGTGGAGGRRTGLAGATRGRPVAVMAREEGK